jgi:hypothetical protein
MPEEFNDVQGVGQKFTERLGQSAEQTDPVTAASLKDQAHEDLGAIKEAVTSTASAAMGKATDTVTDQTNFAARQVGGVATVLKKVGAELESGDQPQVGRYAKQIGESVEAIARKMEGRGLGEIAGMAEDFGRKQPIAFLGVAALAGLAASRFLTASAKRLSSQSSSSTPSGARSSSPEPVGLTPTSGGSTNG